MTQLSAAPVTHDRLLRAAGDADEWLSHGRDLAETRFSPLDQVNVDNVAQLGLAWSYDFPDTRGLEGTPLVADGVMYVTGNWSVVHALDAVTGERLWVYDPGVPRERAATFCCGVVNRGVALWQDTVLLGTLDGYLVAIDRETGAERWRTLTIDPAGYYAITGAPRVANGVVVIGNGGSEFGVRGYVGGYDADTGEQLWRFYTVPGNPADGFETPQMELAAATWTGEWWTMGGGGTVWDSLAYDPELDLLYVGVGNGGPHNRDMRSPGGGDNLFLASIVALRPATGEYVWHYQQNPGETWDYTATQQMILADIPWQGASRKVLMQAPKNGFYFILDRETGELLSAEPFVPVNWASHYDMATGRPVEDPAARYEEAPFMLRPSGLGGHNWHPMSYSPQTGLVYIPALDFAAPMEREEEFSWFDGHWNLGYKAPYSPLGKLLSQALLRRMIDSYLLAWDPLQQREVWRVPNPELGGGGVLSTGGGLVFQGIADNAFKAYHAETGEELWSFDSQHGIVAAPISYRVGGRQYVTVMAGQGGGYSLATGVERIPASPKRRVLTFSLDGSALLPAYELPAGREQPPAANADADTLQRGGEAYNRFCLRCHGAGAVSDGSIPDLRKLDNHWYEQFDAVVLGGSMAGLGMPRFDDVLTPEQAADIKAYVLDRAGEEWELQQDARWWLALKRWVADKVAMVLLLFID
ncbi:PQQ-dependent dehydrogenase, methanol/ethanol family [Pseudohalioglobus sediminis]|uniref:PQQ-dependent dehydrogenase, methanol/ethanol family n=1 Tax=Pseudohalioglobus sediminis TaxID=2606449 RepID=A0A5B0WXZ4_9GAMM|nr:PQQ-dependent dehydrogenase, methanol/ethanol family [Pseudohalioglobus sediminis]KAA1191900.1 PQQ-dependent dehydrogenase, methanol/ethanol family [Pseudohalioglobus sediminis]